MRYQKSERYYLDLDYHNLRGLHRLEKQGNYPRLKSHWEHPRLPPQGMIYQWRLHLAQRWICIPNDQLTLFQ